MHLQTPARALSLEMHFQEMRFQTPAYELSLEIHLQIPAHALTRFEMRLQAQLTWSFSIGGEGSGSEIQSL